MWWVVWGEVWVNEREVGGVAHLGSYIPCSEEAERLMWYYSCLIPAMRSYRFGWVAREGGTGVDVVLWIYIYVEWNLKEMVNASSALGWFRQW